MARVYADVNQNMPRSYWDYDSVNISMPSHVRAFDDVADHHLQVGVS